MEFSWWFLLYVFGSLGLFIYGLKVMSEGIQRAAGPQMRQVLSRMTGNKVAAITTGFVITSIIQSSSASTVLTVGFVNAGLVSLTQSVGVIMGINIGTTITGWLISILDLQFHSTKTILPLFILIIPMLFSKNKILNAWGDFFMGFLLLVIGLIFMKDQVPDFSLLSEKLHFINELSSYGYFSLLIMVFTGVLATILLQSSTATMALTIILCNKGWLPFEVASAMILGANIGTTSTAEIAALIGNSNAKRSARIHTLFNVFGAIWMFPLLPFFIKGVDMLGLSLFYDQSAYDEQNNIPIALSIFHSSFNIINTCIFLFIPQVLIKAANKTVKKTDAQLEEKTELTQKTVSNIFTLPELSIIQTKKRISDLIHDLRKLNQYIILLNNETELDQKLVINDSIFKLNGRIKNFLSIIEMDVEEVISQETSKNTAKQINLIQETNQKLELIYSNYLNILERFQFKNNSGLWFDPVQRNYIKLLLEKQFVSLKPILLYFEKNQIPALDSTSIGNVELKKYSDSDSEDNSTEENTATNNKQKGILVYSEINSLLILNSEIINKCIQQISLSANVK